MTDMKVIYGLLMVIMLGGCTGGSNVINAGESYTIDKRAHYAFSTRNWAEDRQPRGL